MALVLAKHKFDEYIKREMVNPKYETRPYISGGVFLFFGSISTNYRKELISFDGYKDVNTGMCRFCGQVENSEIHNIIIKTDGI